MNTSSTINTDATQLIKLYKDTSNTSQNDLDYTNLISKINSKADSTAIPTIPTNNLNAVSVVNTDSLQLI